jgi:hypothetical protein
MFETSGGVVTWPLTIKRTPLLETQGKSQRGRHSHPDGEVCVGPVGGVDQKCITFGVVFTAFQMLRNMDQATIGCASLPYTDTLGNNIAGRFIGRVDHFRSGILVLTITRKGDADHLAPGDCIEPVSSGLRKPGVCLKRSLIRSKMDR